MEQGEASVADVDLRVALAHGRKRDALVLANPVMTASGTLGADGGGIRFGNGRRLGAWVTPGVSRVARRPYHPSLLEAPAGVVCATPYPTVSSRWLLPKLAEGHARETPVIVNLPAFDIDETAALAMRFEEDGTVAAVELDLSACDDLDAIAQTVGAVFDSCTLPLIAKLSPAGGDVVAGARAAVAAGADAVCVAGTFPALTVDLSGRRARLGARPVLAGAATKPMTLRLVYDVAGAVPVPVIASGGVVTWHDAVQYLQAGATAVQVGTASFANPAAAFDTIDGLTVFLRDAGEGNVRALIGAGRSAAMARSVPLRAAMV
jgi:dihydroorotate dehydrogenase (NAD+) catalytic subunit